MGAGIECDLRLTRDGRIVVFHDGDAVRLCGDPLVFAHATLSDVAQLRLGGAPIPTVEDLLDLVQGQVPLLLEVKSEDDSGRWPAALRRALADYRGGFGIMSFNPLIGRLLKAKLPDVRRGFVFDAKLSPFRRRLALSLAAPEFVAVSREIVADPSVQSLRRTVPVYSWTIRTAEERAQAKVQADALIWEADGRP